MEDKDKRTIYYRLLIISAIIIPVIIGFSYAYFLAVVKIKDDKPTVIQGTAVNDMYLSLETENDGYINAGNVIPLTTDQIDEYAEVGTFKVTTGNNPYKINYTISLTDISLPTELKNEYFKWKLICTSCTDTTHNAEGTFASVNSTEMELKADILIDSFSQDDYKLMIWLQESGNDQLETMNKTFKAKVKIDGEFVNTASTAYVPSDYQVVEYVQSTGNEYIDTGINPTGMELGTDITFQLTEINEDKWIFGELFYDSTISTGRGTYEIGIYNNSFFIQMRSYDTTILYKHQLQYDTNKHNLKMNITNIGTLFDNVPLNNEYSNHAVYGNIIDNASYNLYIFGRGSNINFMSKVKIYNLKIYNGENLIRYYIPVKKVSNNEVGLYDAIENIFYDNDSGNGAFIAGPNV